MFEWLESFNPIALAAFAGTFTWLLTAAGAGFVLLTGTLSRRVLDVMLGFAAGVMIAASVWSLLIPAMDMAQMQGKTGWYQAAVGFVAGGIFLVAMDKTLPHLHPGHRRAQAEGLETQWSTSVLLVLAITLHNIPEGLAVGVAFGGADPAGDADPVTSLSAAVALTIGIAIQNVPEGIAVALPLRAVGASRLKSFWYGQMSALVEPVAATAGAALVYFAAPILPYALAFAAGAMMYVVVEELIPESHEYGNADIATLGALGGFVVMMVLDTSLG